MTVCGRSDIIFIFQTNEDDMRECFSKYGKIMDVYIPRERPDMKSRGFAFVTFNNKRDAEDAVDEMHEYVLILFPFALYTKPHLTHTGIFIFISHII